MKKTKNSPSVFYFAKLSLKTIYCRLKSYNKLKFLEYFVMKLTSFFFRSFPFAKKWILVSTAVIATLELGAAFTLNLTGLPGRASSSLNLIET